MHQSNALQTWEYLRIALLFNGVIIGQHHAATRTAQCLVRRGCDHMRVTEGRRVRSARDQASEVGHVDHEICAHFMGNGTEARKGDVTRIGSIAGDDDGGAALVSQLLHGVAITEVRVLTYDMFDGDRTSTRLNSSHSCASRLTHHACNKQ